MFKKLDDEDFADGINKAYLCAFRITKALRGQGYGTKLITTVINHIKSMGFQKATIVVDETEPDNQRFYERLGFTRKIKDSYIDPCNMDERMKPKACDKIYLLEKEL